MPFIKLYGAAFGAILFAILAFSLKFSEKEWFPVKTPFFETAIPVTSKLVGRALFLTCSLAFLLYYPSLDFGEFFQQYLEMEVFYDQPGINESLAVFTPQELKSLGYDGKNAALSSIYYTDLDKKLKEIMRLDQFFLLKDGIVHSKGATSFKVTKVSGINNYYISESKGEVVHVLERPQLPPVAFKSFFEKLPSPYDYIRPSLRNMLIDQSIVLRPRFKQLLAEQNKAEGTLFDHILVGATKVFILPLPRFSNTVYFSELPGVGLVPIGYAVYK
jgi:hypothetical protein